MKYYLDQKYLFILLLFLVLYTMPTLHSADTLPTQDRNPSQDPQLKLFANFKSQQALNNAIKKLKQKNLQPIVKKLTEKNSYTRLELGPFPLKRDAVGWLQPLINEGFKAKLIARTFDFVIELGKFTSSTDLIKSKQKAKSLGYSLLREVPVENKITSWDLYTKPVNQVASKVINIIQNSKPVGNYKSRQKALEKARKINKNNSLRAFVIQKKKNIVGYFLGPYSSRRDADKIIQRLKRGRIKHKLKWDKTKLAYIISIIDIDKKLSSKLLYSLLEELNIGLPHRKFITQISYEVVVQARQKNSIREKHSKNKKQKSFSNTSSNKNQRIQQKTVLTTLSSSRAKQKVLDLKRKGVSSNVQQQIEDVTLEALVLTNITSWNQARQISKKLKQQGIDAFPISNRHNKNFSISVGYSVSIGIYQNRENIKKQLHKVRQLGYNNIEIVNYKKQITSYQVIASRSKPDIDTVIESNNANAESSKSDATNSSLFETSDDEEMLVFLDTDSLATGEANNTSSDIFSDEKPYQFTLQSISSNYNVQSNREDIDGIFTNRANAFATVKLNPELDAKISLKIKYWKQQGVLELDNSEVLLDDAFVRYRGANYRLTLGNQTVLWGRLDGDSPVDMMSSRDLSFLVLDNDLSEQRISDSSIRIESYFDQYKLDFLYTPKPTATLVPDESSSWSFINKATGNILGVEPVTVLQQLAINGSIEKTKNGDAAWGLRFSHAGENLDYALTAQQTRIQTPFYSLNPETLLLLLNGNSIEDAITLTQGDTFLVYQPKTTVVGGDFGWVEGVSTVRGEITWLSDYPVIRESTLLFDTSAAINWGIGFETYPEGAEDTRIIVQIVGTEVLDTEDTLGKPSSISMNGQLETFFFRDRWRTRINFLAGLNRKDFYINPEVSYIGVTNHEFYLGFHHFQGDDDTLGGFFENSDTITLGWRGTFN